MIAAFDDAENRTVSSSDLAEADPDVKHAWGRSHYDFILGRSTINSDGAERISQTGSLSE